MITLNQAVELFLLDRSAVCVEKTVKDYREKLNFFVNYMCQLKDITADSLMITDITFVDLNMYTIYLRNKNKFENHPFFGNKDLSGRLSNNTIRTYQRSVKVFYNFLYDNEYIDTNPARRWRFIKSEKKEKLPLYQYEVKRIDDLYNDKCHTGLRNLCIIHLMLDAGLRMSEVVHLKIKDVLFDKNLLFIENSKGNKSRYVPVGNTLKQYLYKYLILFRSISPGQIGMQEYNKNEPLLLKVRSNVPITEDCIKQLFQKLKKQADIERIHPHLCRHTFATSYIINGGDLESLRILLGHEDITTTQKYLHLANTYLYLDSDVYKIDKIYRKRL